MLAKEGTQKEKVKPRDWGSRCHTNNWNDNIDSKHINRWHWQTSQDKQSLILPWKGVFTCRWRNWWCKLTVVEPSAVLGQRKLEVWNKTLLKPLLQESQEMERWHFRRRWMCTAPKTPAKGTKITAKRAPYLASSTWHNSYSEWFHCVPGAWSRQRVSPTPTSFCFLSAKCFSTYWSEMVWKVSIWSLFSHRIFLRYTFIILVHLQYLQWLWWIHGTWHNP